MQYIYAIIGPKSETMRKMITRKIGTSISFVLPTDSIKLDLMLRIIAKLALVLCGICCELGMMFILWTKYAYSSA